MEAYNIHKHRYRYITDVVILIFVLHFILHLQFLHPLNIISVTEKGFGTDSC